MRKHFQTESGYALIVVLAVILVMGLLTPVMLTAATYGMKNTISTNNNINARYLADTAYQESLNKINIAKASNLLMDESDINRFINNEIINLNSELNGGTYTTNYHPDYSASYRPKKVLTSGGDPRYIYYFRSTGKAENQKAFVDYTVSFILKKVGGTTILYEKSNKRSTYDHLPTSPDNLKAIATGETGLNGKVQNDIKDKLDGSSYPNIAFKYNLSPAPSFYKSELKSSETINKSARVSKVDIGNNASLTVNGDLYVENDLILKNNVTLTIKGNLYIGTNFSAGNNATIKVTRDLISKNNINFNNNIHFDIGGNMFVQGGLNVENNASKSKIDGSLYVLNNIDIGNNGQLKVTNDIVANNIKLTNNTSLKTGGEVLVKNEFEANNNANVELARGLEVGTQLKLSNNVEFSFAEKLYITNLLDLGNNGKMLLLKTGGGSGGSSYKVEIEDPAKI